jgi:hypothetical protein
MEGNATISLKQTQFCLKQFANRMQDRNFSACNRWKKVSVAGFMEKKHRFKIQGQNRCEQLQDGPLLWETTVPDILETIESGLPLENVNNAQLIRREWVRICVKQCAGEVREARKKGK